MKILLCNKFYYSRGGADVYTIELGKLLKNKGHDVAIFAMQHSNNISSEFSQYFPSEVDFLKKNIINILKLATRPIYSIEVKRKFKQLLKDFRPDVVHLNNIHSQLSPILAEIAHKKGMRVVWTLHDYKLLCPRYDCLRNGIENCELCFNDKKNVLRHKCMKNSLFASIIAYMEAIKWNRERLEKYTDAFICPSHFMNNKMEQGGFKPNKLYTHCNSIDVEKTKKNNFSKENYYCYLGRLSHEKGIETLLKAASSLPYHLKIIGGGTMEKTLKANFTYSNIEFIGYKKWDEIKGLVGKALFTVIPSEWYENNPLSIIEAHCLGTPVLGANIGGIPELIKENVNGILFKSGDVEDLTQKIEYCWKELKIDYKALALQSQNTYSDKNYYKEILSVYQSLKINED